MARDENEGIGKPEPLKREWSGYCSRRITSEHRLVCRINDAAILVAACRYHYEKFHRAQITVLDLGDASF